MKIDFSFSCRGQDFDPPACDTGLILLHRWAAHDPTLDRMLPEILDNAEGKFPEAFYRHRNQCPRCNEGGWINIPDDAQYWMARTTKND
jgi:hypothetical protein